MSLAPELAWGLLLLVGIQRLVELRISASHEREASAADARPAESRAAYAAMVVCHVLLLVLPALEVAVFGVGLPLPVSIVALAGFVAAQVLRFWAIRSLGPSWNVRAVVRDGQEIVARGPYRHVRHPNYLAVCLEFVTIPLFCGAWRSLLLLHLLHAPVLARRIHAEERLLSERTTWREAMADKPALLPLGFGKARRTG